MTAEDQSGCGLKTAAMFSPGICELMPSTEDSHLRWLRAVWGAGDDSLDSLVAYVRLSCRRADVYITGRDDDGAFAGFVFGRAGRWAFVEWQFSIFPSESTFRNWCGRNEFVMEADSLFTPSPLAVCRKLTISEEKRAAQDDPPEAVMIYLPFSMLTPRRLSRRSPQQEEPR
jgi:hypothetical protein